MRTLLVPAFAALLLPLVLRADDTLSASQIAVLEHRGWITPRFESAARDLIAAKESAQQSQADQANLQAGQPALEKSVATEDAQVAQLKAEARAL